MLMTPFETYQTYLGLKNHFTNPKYDYFKYNRKVKATTASFNKRRDKYFFERTSRKYSDEEVLNFMLSNFVSTDNPQNLWIGEIIKNGEENYSEWVKRQQSLTYLFKEQSNELFSTRKLNEVFSCSKGHPLVLKKYLRSEISLETLIILLEVFSLRKKYDEKLTDPVWESVSLKVKKYIPFININMLKYKKILRNIVNE